MEPTRSPLRVPSRFVIAPLPGPCRGTQSLFPMLSEAPSPSCGLDFELALLLPGLIWLRGARVRGRGGREAAKTAAATEAKE